MACPRRQQRLAVPIGRADGRSGQPFDAGQRRQSPRRRAKIRSMVSQRLLFGTATPARKARLGNQRFRQPENRPSPATARGCHPSHPIFATRRLQSPRRARVHRRRLDAHRPQTPARLYPQPTLPLHRRFCRALCRHPRSPAQQPRNRQTLQSHAHAGQKLPAAVPHARWHGFKRLPAPSCQRRLARATSRALSQRSRARPKAA